MSEDDVFDASKIPLGDLPSDEQFRQWQEEARFRRLDVEFIDLNKYPEFVKSVESIRLEVESERARLGFDASVNSWPELRLIDGTDWNDIAVSAGHTDLVSGFYDRGSNVIFLEADKEYFGKDANKISDYLYAVAHELHHFLMPIDMYSFHLSEALVDDKARKVFETKFPGKTYSSPYREQARLLKSMIEKMGHENYSGLVKMSYRGDIEAIRGLIKNHFGEEVEQMLDDSKGLSDITEVRKRIEES